MRSTACSAAAWPNNGTICVPTCWSRPIWSIRLQQARRLILGPDFGSFRGRVDALQSLERAFPFLFKEEDTLREGARSEEVFRNPRPEGHIQRVAYGHTHRARHDYFHGNQDGTVKMYINTGTYLPLITQAEDGESFASSIQMVYVYLYRVDEDLDTKQPGTTSMDMWTGIRESFMREHGRAKLLLLLFTVGCGASWRRVDPHRPAYPRASRCKCGAVLMHGSSTRSCALRTHSPGCPSSSHRSVTAAGSRCGHFPASIR